MTTRDSSMRHLLFCLLLPALVLGADPVTWQHTEKGEIQYLTIQDGRACLQLADGFSIGSMRLLPDGNGVASYLLGKPTGVRIEQAPSSVTLQSATGVRTVFSPCATPPETIGWLPYVLPPTQADAAKRKLVADELVKRFAKEQELRGTAMRLSQGRMSQEAMAKPEVKKAWAEISATDEDNRLWLERTLRSDGWIGRKSHGDKAHEALLLISLHNVQHLRFSATILEQMRAEQKRGEIAEMSVANIADRVALILGDPLSYGIQATVDATGKPVIPVIADGDRLEANRARIGVGSLASAVAMMGAKVLRIGEDGRLVGEGVINARGLDAVDGQRALREPAWGLDAIATADPALGAAITAGKAGDAKPITAWTRSANLAHLGLVAQVLMAQGSIPGTDSEAAVVALRPLFDGMLAGLPAAADGLTVMMANVLAYSLVARATPPSAEELARAGILGDQLDAAVRRPEVARSPNGHAITDTIACIRFLQGDRTKAAGLWKKAIELAGAQAPELYRKRLAVAQGQDAKIPLPR
jgi:hypothetical protein